MAASGNFGNMFSVVIASLFLPFLPMLPIHILIQNLLCDFSQMGMPFDRVDAEFLTKPRKWDTKSLKAFMVILGPISSIFDVLCFLVMFYVIKANTAELAPLFQCGWFIFGTVSQILIIHMIRTAKIPFFQSNGSKRLYLSTSLVVIVTLLIGFTDLGSGVNMLKAPILFMPWLVFLLISYCVCVQVIKKVYVNRYGEWL